MMQSLRLACTIALTACVISCAPEQTENSAPQTNDDSLEKPLLEIVDEKLHTTHSLKYAFTAGDGFRLTTVSNRKDVFNDTPFMISRAAFIRDNEAAMIHAETVADQSNASNYDNLPEATWPSGAFRSNGPICFEISAEDIANEDDPQWLIQNGFSPVGTLMFSQAFCPQRTIMTKLSSLYFA